MVVPELPTSSGPGGLAGAAGAARDDRRARRPSTRAPEGPQRGGGAGHVVAVGEPPHHRHAPCQGAEQQGPMRDRLVARHADPARQGPAALPR